MPNLSGLVDDGGLWVQAVMAVFLVAALTQLLRLFFARRRPFPGLTHAWCAVLLAIGLVGLAGGHRAALGVFAASETGDVAVLMDGVASAWLPLALALLLTLPLWLLQVVIELVAGSGTEAAVPFRRWPRLVAALSVVCLVLAGMRAAFGTVLLGRSVAAGLPAEAYAPLSQVFVDAAVAGVAAMALGLVAVALSLAAAARRPLPGASADGAMIGRAAA